MGRISLRKCETHKIRERGGGGALMDAHNSEGCLSKFKIAGLRATADSRELLMSSRSDCRSAHDLWSWASAPKPAFFIKKDIPFSVNRSHERPAPASFAVFSLADQNRKATGKWTCPSEASCPFFVMLFANRCELRLFPRANLNAGRSTPPARPFPDHI